MGEDITTVWNWLKETDAGNFTMAIVLIAIMSFGGAILIRVGIDILVAVVNWLGKFVNPSSAQMHEYYMKHDPAYRRNQEEIDRLTVELAAEAEKIYAENPGLRERVAAGRAERKRLIERHRLKTK